MKRNKKEIEQQALYFLKKQGFFETKKIILKINLIRQLFYKITDLKNIKLNYLRDKYFNYYQLMRNNYYINNVRLEKICRNILLYSTESVEFFKIKRLLDKNCFEIYVFSYQSVLKNYVSKKKLNYISFTILDEIIKVKISKEEIYVYFDKVFESIKNIDVIFYDYLLQLKNDGYIYIENRGVGYSFCANLPYSDKQVIYIELEETVEDIFNFCHELGHAYYYFYKNQCDDIEHLELLNEMYAYIFEISLVLSLEDKNLIKEYFKRTYINLFYRLLYIVYIDNVKMNPEINLEDIFIFTLKYIFGDVLYISEVEKTNWKSNLELYLHTEDFFMYLISNFYAIYCVCNNKIDIYNLKYKITEKDEEILNSFYHLDNEAKEDLYIYVFNWLCEKLNMV